MRYNFGGVVVDMICHRVAVVGLNSVVVKHALMRVAIVKPCFVAKG